MFLGNLELSNFMQFSFKRSMIFLIFPAIECSFWGTSLAIWPCSALWLNLVSSKCCKPSTCTFHPPYPALLHLSSNILQFTYLLCVCLLTVSLNKNRKLHEGLGSLTLLGSLIFGYVSQHLDQCLTFISICWIEWEFADLEHHPTTSPLSPKLSVVSSGRCLFLFTFLLLKIPSIQT